ncbi:L-fucose mutarotase/ribose pyranase (RbsD/FucU family) [Paenibacillus jamilae]|jgi:L-fucose mutarotase/ribose pyranase (RbsD/FucU family)|uniref:hypothetical protein n=1 Tax=Paenibacillus polymyxa TaxID=1406 RepID=UPI0015803FB5|nr:hypothetical protein [Paenibacillus polymyxa]MDP9674847.1 L-fucose mutarotase/ribose pyranase (RbsD/FucU family) [Paenibacillus jamilae]MBY0023786.1 hypothetical protein [Paenibacillus polymyxa]MBY0056458.1 hypothetical protein [Paenibacillus polymyxa]MBY0071805.1 hypothetical protein [Paenibacillus polymyxa]MBY0080629.1 hypothetical protein [Paenibacillus polymyxa]
MTKQTYREVKREANVGERIKIVNPQVAIGYGKGDEGSVTETRTSGVFAQINGQRCGVWHEEYVVLEPVASTNTPDISDAFTQFIRDNADTIRAILGGVAKTEPAALTRAAVIEKARADVAELTRKMRSGSANSEGNYTFNQCISKPEFYINRNKRAVTVLVRGIYGNAILEKGIAKAAPDDVFHAEIGKAIALRRALGLTVPSEYTDAPKPDDLRKGHIVAKASGHKCTVHAVRPTHRVETGHRFSNPEKGFTHLFSDGYEYWDIIADYTIIDDTDVDYSVATEGAAA